MFTSSRTWILALGVMLVLTWSDGRTETVKVYVGSQACADCHQDEYLSFLSHAKKARSYESVEVMRDGLSDVELRQCYECHTTGYGKPGGFRSVDETPGLENAGCEVCHGPGSAHVESGEAGDIDGDLETEDCEGCHNAERVEAFSYKPLVFGGAH